MSDSVLSQNGNSNYSPKNKELEIFKDEDESLEKNE